MGSSDDEHVPAETGIPPILPHPLDAINYGSDARNAAQTDSCFPFAPTPKRPGDSLGDSWEPNEIKVEINMNDSGLAPLGAKTIRLAVN